MKRILAITFAAVVVAPAAARAGTITIFIAPLQCTVDVDYPDVTYTPGSAIKVTGKPGVRTDCP